MSEEKIEIQVPVWPDFFPKDCPPEDAEDATGELFRLVNSKDKGDLEKCFQGHFILFPKRVVKGKECQACGVSVSRTLGDCKAARELAPSLRKKIILHGVLEHPVGKIAHTPLDSGNPHYTWWIPLETSPWENFKEVKE